MRKRYKGARRNIGCLIPTLIILCVLAAGTLYFINDNMVFTREGAVFSPRDDRKPDEEEVNANLVIEEPEKIPSPPEKLPDEPTHAAFIPRAEVGDAEAVKAKISQLKNSGINTIVFEVKSDDGFLAFKAKSQLALAAEVSSPDNDALRSVTEAAKASGLDVAYYVSCFKDNEAARKSQQCSVRTENLVIWLDGYNARWLSLYSQSAREYIKDIVQTLKEFSPDEIILANISFPAIGKTEIISYGEDAKPKAEMIASFIGEIKEVVPDSVKLSAVYENYVGEALNSSGQSLDMFAGHFAKLYIRDSAGKATAALTEDMKRSLAEKGQNYCTVIELGAEDEEARRRTASGGYMLRPTEDQIFDPPVR